jgi:hypothetical protein
MEAVEAPKEHGLLHRIRNMWEFANLVQWIFIFGRAVKIDENLDVEVGRPLVSLMSPLGQPRCRLRYLYNYV